MKTATDGIPFVINQIMTRIERELVKSTRKPSARKADPAIDEPARCYHCRGDGDYRCNCGGLGYVENDPSVILIVWRDFHSIEVQASFHADKTKVVDAWVCGSTEPEYPVGTSISLTWEEEAEAMRALNQ